MTGRLPTLTMPHQKFRVYPVIGRLDFPNELQFGISWLHPVTGRRLSFTQHEIQPAAIRQARKLIEHTRLDTFYPLRVPWCKFLSSRRTRWVLSETPTQERPKVTG